MAIIDFVIIAIALGAAVYGLHLGFVRQISVGLGVFTGLVMSAFFASQVAALAKQTSLQWVLLSLLLVVMVMLYAAVGRHVGQWLHVRTAKSHKLQKADKVAGGVAAAVGTIVLLWLAAGMLYRAPVGFIAHQVNNSYVFFALDTILPSRPDIFRHVADVLDTYHVPEFFVGAEPRVDSVPDVRGDLSQVSIGAAKSVVKVEASGCGYVSQGSGFVAGNEALVVTNAHVIAGGTTLWVRDSGDNAYPATPLYVDALNDIAVLYAKGVDGAPLAFGDGNRRNYGSPAVIIGYPGGGDIKASQAVIWRRMQAMGRDIYNQHEISRDLFMIAGNVVPGNSGGPLLDEEGKVIGVIVGHSYTQDNAAFALVTDKWASFIASLGPRTAPVSTGRCQ